MVPGSLHPCICLPLASQYGVYRLPARCVPACSTSPLHSSSGVNAALLGMSKRLGYAGGNVSLFPSGINPAGPGNSSIMANKPGTESTCAQGLPESRNPSGDDLPLHPRVTARLFTPFWTSRYLLVYVGILIKSTRK